MSSGWVLAAAGARAHRAALTGTALTLAAAGAVLSVVGVLMESGLRAGGGGGLLTTLASSYAGTALIVVVLVVAATVTLALRGRRRELALLRTIGATRGQVRQQVSREVLLVAAIAVPLGAVPGTLLAGRLVPLLSEAGFPRPGSGLVLSPLPALAALALLLPTALLAGRLAARETLRTAPTDAVRQSAVESPALGRTRQVCALLAAVAGLSAAFTPLVVPGTIGSATAATSAFLLIGAVALAGPLLVEWAFARVARAGGTRLALLNLRGFSRRLTTVVVPLALALGTGTVQTSVDRAVTTAAEQQLTASVTAEHVATGSAAGLAELAEQPGTVALGDVPVEVHSDLWETTALRTVSAEAPATLFDPGVTAGSLAALSEPGTVAVGADAAFELGLDPGDRVRLRHDGTEQQLEVVAVYDRGLGVGDYLATPDTARALGAEPVVSAVLLDGDPTGASTGASTGVGLTSPAAYAAAATSASAAAQRLSTVLLLILLVFVGLGAANALALTTAGRRSELDLLRRTGATRRQLLRMVTTEAVVTALLAWAVGTAVVVPAVLGVSFGLLGAQVPVVDLAAYAVLSATVIAVTLVTTVAAAARATRPQAQAANRSA